MFTVFSTYRSYPMNDNDRHTLSEIMSFLPIAESFPWLREIPWERVMFRFCPAITKNDSIMGAFSILHPLTVFLRDFSHRTESSPGQRSFWIEIIFPSIIHELRHLWQFKKHPILFILCSIPGLRELTIERDAELCRKEAETFSENYTRKRDREDFASRITKKNVSDNIQNERKL